MHPDTIDPGSEVTKPVQPPFLRPPVEAIRPVPQQDLQVTEVCALPPRSARRRPRPPRVQDPRTQVGEHLVAHPDIELLCPEGRHPASFARCRHTPGARGRTQRPTTARQPAAYASPAACECDCGALGRQCPPRVHGPDAGRWRATSAADPRRVRRYLRSAPPAPVTAAGAAHRTRASACRSDRYARSAPGPDGGPGPPKNPRPT